MINEKELIISGKSYINKDFSSIYPEQIDIFKTLTNRYDPETSNESDPGIVALKTNAFVTDKLCYNIDKNVLENYMPSATQESSMSDLCARLGYDMKYYEASATDIYIKYTGSAFNSTSSGGIEGADNFIIPQFTEISSSDGTIVFTTIKQTTYKKTSEYVTIPALQGSLQSLKVADSEVIQLENLNNQNRIYFNESMIAQNGIFVRSVDNSSDEWYITSNLNLELPNTKCFKFGYDSSKRWPYIEFPADIASIIGSGLTIQYLVTNGETGNVSANTLTNITNYTEFAINDVNGNEISDAKVTISEDDSSELIVKNTSASIGGSNPESIDEAYNNFKRTIGTFDTLVTCRDYANAIYNLYDENNVYPVVSNCQVADRRDDINYCNKILTLDEYGTKFEYASSSSITAFDLCLYPLKSITSYTDKNYIESFKPKNNLTYIVDSLENGKTISHDYKQLNLSDIYAIKNKYKLNVKLTTTYKVTQYERVSIITNVLSALIKKFNARNVDYGEEIPYETILETIQNADARINYVSMAEPAQVTCFMSAGGNEEYLSTTTGRNQYLSILAKNILAGRISLFNLYDMFDFEFNQADGVVKSELDTIDSVAEIALDNGDEYSLSENEVIQIIGPSFVTTIPYGYGVRYHYDGQTISKDAEYKLGQNEELKIRYKASDKEDYTVMTYKTGDIIKPTFELNDTDNVTGTVDVDGIKYAMIESDQEIDIRKLNESTLSDFTYCYWLRNTKQNTLFTASDEITPAESGASSTYEVMLQDGEYFFYKKGLKDDFIALGSGTILTVDESTYDGTNWSIEDTVTVEDIANNGSDAIKWKQIRFSASKSLNIKETSILTLTSGDTIELSADSGTTLLTLNNSLQDLSSDITVQYQIQGESEKTLSKIIVNDSSYTWKIKSRLDINAGPDLAQVVDSANSTHKIKFKFKDNSTLPASGYYGDSSNKGYSFKLNEKQQFVGSSNIVASSYDIATGNTIYPLSVYVYKQNSTESIESFRGELGFINVSVDGTTFKYIDSNDLDFETTLKLPLQSNTGLLTIYYQKIDSGSDNPEITSLGSQETSTSKLRFYNEGTEDEDEETLELKEGINVIKISAGAYFLEFTSYAGIKGILSIGELTYLDSDSEFNPVLNLQTGEDSTLLSKISAIDTQHKFFYNNKISKDNLIDVEDMSSPYSFYEYNNIANKFTISEIDIEDSNIDVVKTSLL